MKCAIHLTSIDTPEGAAQSLMQAAGEFPVITIEATKKSVPQLCLEINGFVNEIGAQRLVLISSGARCLDLPAIARAQAAVHRAVISYALLSPVFPVSTDQWPNAPVTVYLPADQDPERSVSLRGFEVVHFATSAELASTLAIQIVSAQ